VKIAIMGTGGVGGYFGGRLSRAGQHVTFIARGEHLKAIRQNGLSIKSVNGDFDLTSVVATDNPAEVGHVDLILFTTKTYQTDDAARAIKPMIGKDTVIVSFQNGIDAAESVGSIVGMNHMLAGTAWIYASVEAPGVIRQYSQFSHIAIGEISGRKTPRLKHVFDVLSSSGVTVEMSNNMQKALWTKYIYISAVSAIGCLTRVPLGNFRDVPETRALLTAAISEVTALAVSKGVDIEADVIDTTLSLIDSLAPEIKPSMQRDVETGRVSELESMIGAAPRLARLLKVPTPVMEFAYDALKPREALAQMASQHALGA
jgi:2-dehydropantoate 2-reductase